MREIGLRTWFPGERRSSGGGKGPAGCLEGGSGAEGGRQAGRV